MKALQVRSKIWLEVDGMPLLGNGRMRLLLGVQRHGSISAAARELGTSYRKAWTQLQAMEDAAPFPILERRVGGKDGGASQLTREALALAECYQALRARVERAVDDYFAECFAEDETPR